MLNENLGNSFRELKLCLECIIYQLRNSMVVWMLVSKWDATSNETAPVGMNFVWRIKTLDQNIQNFLKDQT